MPVPPPDTPDNARVLQRQALEAHEHGHWEKAVTAASKAIRLALHRDTESRDTADGRTHAMSHGRRRNVLWCSSCYAPANRRGIRP
ncbi:hypothetical protein SAMN02982994_1651 [Azospirillum lipoferum]|nr:hypothetical protein SAMN02982994_1651 [Azospirillum lipoferum]